MPEQHGSTEHWDSVYEERAPKNVPVDDEIDQSGLALCLGLRKTGELSAWRRHPDGRKQHVRQTDIRCEAKTAVGLGRKVQPWERLARDLAGPCRP